MTAQDQPRGSREAYERLSDPAMYWTQVNAQPIREPIRRELPQDQAREQSPDPYRELSPDPYRELSPDWEPESGEEETRLAELLPYGEDRPYEEDRPAYDDPRTYPAEGYRTEDYRTDSYPTDTRRNDRYHADDELEAHERFGGVNWGAGFFGWLVTVAFAVFLTGVLGVAFTVLRTAVPTVASTVEARPGVAAAALAAAGVAVLMMAYYTGGYVAGRMSRFDGGRQGAGVWITGVLLTAVMLGAGLVFGSSSDLLDRVHLPSVSVPAGATGLVGLAAVVVAAVGSLLCAIAGGKVGCKYHRKVDEYL